MVFYFSCLICLVVDLHYIALYKKYQSPVFAKFIYPLTTVVPRLYITKIQLLIYQLTYIDYVKVKGRLLNPDFAFCSYTRLFTDDRKRSTPFRTETFTSGSWPVEQSTWPQCWRWVHHWDNTVANTVSFRIVSDLYLCRSSTTYSIRNWWQSETHMKENRCRPVVTKLHWVPASGRGWMKDMKRSLLTRWRKCWGTSAHAAMPSCTAQLLGQGYGPNRRPFACSGRSRACRPSFPKKAWARGPTERRQRRASRLSELLLESTVP